jgi:hypothetical protein
MGAGETLVSSGGGGGVAIVGLASFTFKGGFLDFSFTCTIHCFICRPSDSTVSEDAGIEPRTVATTALTIRRSNHSARSHAQSRLDLIHNVVDEI